MLEPVQTPLDYLYRWEKLDPHGCYLRQPCNGEWHEYTWREVADTARRVASALQSLGVKKGGRVAILSKNCAEWIIADLAMMMAGAISVPLFPMQSKESMLHVLEHSEASVLFLGKLDNLPEVINDLSDSITTIGFNYDGVEAQLKWDDVVKKYSPIMEPCRPELESIFTIVYTSGTTGYPKGVQHSYRAISFVSSNNVKESNLNQNDRFLSFLPLAHVAERVLVEFSSLYAGCAVSFVESLDTFANDIKHIKPTVFGAVPRIWVKLQMKVLEKISQETLINILRVPILGWFVKRKIRRNLGLEKVKDFISGAAPLPESVMVFFRRLGINIQELYGMTENLAYGTFNKKEDIRFGTVGTNRLGGEMKISDEGEVLFRSPAIMKGYYLDKEKTYEVIDYLDFYHTGDAGEICEDGFLKITGRIKDTFKTSKGEFITPTIIEEMLSENTSIEQVCVVGLGMPQPMALVVLSESARSMPKDELSNDLFSTYQKVNAGLKSHETINSLIVVKDEWVPGDYFMTPTLKIKRNELFDNYRHILDRNSEVRGVVWE